MELVSHKLSIQEEENLHGSYCEKVYDMHKYLVHVTEMADQCVNCPQSYKHPSSLCKHKISVHRVKVGKTFKCNQCDMTFITNGNMTHNIRSHTREKHHACSYCSMGIRKGRFKKIKL
jgi:uncharacterized Zn-finger protein